jgi:hypothetical protein
MEIFYWKEWKRPERARARTGSKTGKQEAKQTGGNGWRDIESAAKCWTYADATRGILRQRKKRQYQGAKQEARTDGLKRESA